MSPVRRHGGPARPTRLGDDFAWTFAGVMCLVGVFIFAISFVFMFAGGSMTDMLGPGSAALFFFGWGVWDAVGVWRRRRANAYTDDVSPSFRAKWDRSAGEVRLLMAPWMLGCGLVLAAMAAYFLVKSFDGGGGAAGNRIGAAGIGVVAAFGIAIGSYQFVTGRRLRGRVDADDPES